MIDIIPAILPKKFTDLEPHLERVRGVARVVQVDIVDGVLAPERTWPYGDSQSWERIISGEEGMPLWEDFDFQFDAMLAQPEREVEHLLSAGAASVVLHAAAPGAMAAAHALQPSREAGELSVSVGIAVLPSAGISALAPFEGLYDFVQVMGISRVGRQGEPFDERALVLLAQLRAAYPDVLLQVDGGVSLTTARAIVAAGANRLVVGSALFGAEDAVQSFRALYTEANAR